MMTDPAASGPDPHLDPDRMADLYDGLLDHGAAESARRHLASCERCAEDFALITMDSGLAGSAAESAAESMALFMAPLMAPEPIPLEVAIRVEAALHREPPLSVPTAEPHHSAAPPRSRQSRRFRVMFGSLAGGVLVVAGAFGGIAALSSGKDKTNSGATSSSANSFSKSNAMRGDSQAGGAAPNAVAPSMVKPGTPDTSPVMPALSVEQQAEQLLANSSQNKPQAAGSTGLPRAESSPFACPPKGFESASPLGASSITYGGRPAELLVYPKQGDDTTASVYVVAMTGCTASNPGQVLYSTEVPRS